MFDDNKILCIVVVVLVLMMNFKVTLESFNSNGTEFVPVGDARYGLRGELLDRRDINRYFIKPNRDIRLHSSSGQMYESDFPPAKCEKVPCPSNRSAYGMDDTCWRCDGDKANPMKELEVGSKMLPLHRCT